MKINANTVIEGEKVLLVPYKKEHVEQYNKWMQDPELRKETASELLTLEEEYENQISWYEDPKKLTFILLDKDVSAIPGTKGMCGDCNLFYNQESDEEAEIEIMIAEKGSRRKGIARESLILLMSYACLNLNTKKFIAKISEDNLASQKLFLSLGFQQVSEPNYFREITFEYSMTKDSKLLKKSLNIKPYN